jgi:cyclopropane-fatty-acyl-phospholipid synthase
LALATAERVRLPDRITRAGIELLVGRTAGQLARAGRDEEARFAAGFGDLPIAQYTQAANEQHYELPPEFFALTLGPRMKYSCCLYATLADPLERAERNALVQTCRHADLAGARHILELGCGWGSLSLFMAETYPDAQITAVSNSAPQREFILKTAAARGLRNLRVVTADMNDFVPDRPADRIVSVEMFEHMANWRALLERVRSWLTPDGKLFLHVFTHATTPYRFDHTDKTDWIAQYFFTGGLMPSQGLIRCFPDLFTVEGEWRWSGDHYMRTARDWLANFDRNEGEIRRILRAVYGAEAGIWFRRWRLFYLATGGLFGHAGGQAWGVGHYLLRPAD